MKVELKVTGMSCDGCVRHVTKALAKVPGASDVKVELSASRATVELDESKGASVDALLRAVVDAGYAAERR